MSWVLWVIGMLRGNLSRTSSSATCQPMNCHTVLYGLGGAVAACVELLPACFGT